VWFQPTAEGQPASQTSRVSKILKFFLIIARNKMSKNINKFIGEPSLETFRQKVSFFFLSKISGSHDGEYDDENRLGYSAM
jgi:hypothetical protein